MFAAAAVAVLAENHANRVAAVNFLNRAGKFPCRRISVLDFAVARENAHAVRSSRSGIGANNVVVQHCAYGVALLFGPIQQAVRAEQALLFAGKHAKEKRRAKAAKLSVTVGFRPAQEARAFHANGGAGAVIVGSGSVGFG